MAGDRALMPSPSKLWTSGEDLAREIAWLYAAVETTSWWRVPAQITKQAERRSAKTLKMRLTGTALVVVVIGKGKAHRMHERADEGQAVPHLGQDLVGRFLTYSLSN